MKWLVGLVVYDGDCVARRCSWATLATEAQGVDRIRHQRVEVANEAAFYGPKIDVQVWSAIGREFTTATS